MVNQARLQDYGVMITRRRRPGRPRTKPRPMCDACFYFAVATDRDGDPLPCNTCGRLLCRGCKRPGAHICKVAGQTTLSSVLRRRQQWRAMHR